MIPDPMHISGNPGTTAPKGWTSRPWTTTPRGRPRSCPAAPWCTAWWSDQFAGFWTTSGPTAPGLVLIAVIPEWSDDSGIPIPARRRTRFGKGWTPRPGKG